MAVKVLAKRGTASEIEGALASIQSAGEIAFATDTKEFYVSDGTQFNKIGKDQLSQFSEISVVTDVNTWTLNQDNSLDLNPPESSPTGITFKPDGTKVFTIGYGRNRVQMYDLSTAWDLTSAGSATESEYLVQNNLSSVQEDFFIDSSGTRMYVLSRNSDSVGQFTLNTAWDISDITFVQDLHINSTSLSGNVTGIVTGESDPCGLTFKPDGTILYLVGYTQDKVHQIPLSTAWDISTHGTITDFNITPANASQAIQFSSDGKEMYIGDYSTESIVHFTLSTAWDVTTATLVSRGVPFLENFGLPTSTGFYFNDVAGKAFVCGRSGDYAYEVVITDAIKFTDPVSAPMLYGDTVHAGNIITSNVGANYFYNALYARSTFISLTTSYLGDSSPTPSIRFGNTVYGGGQVVVHRNLYTNNNGGNVPEFRIMQPRIGGRGIIKIGKEYETTAYLEGGTVDIESEASTFDHLGEFTLGGELKIGGTKPLAYKDPNLYTSGTQIVLDNFNETADTDITSHTPDTGSGYTQVYASNGVTDDDIPFIPANGGYLKAERSNSNDGRRYVNDTTISTNNYEVRAVIKQQVNGDDPFSIVVKYIDENNYFVMHFAANYNYCYPYSVINGVATQYGALYYYANTSTADNLGLEVAVRVVGNQVSVFYEGQYRGSKEINITGAGKAGFGFGRTSDLYGTSFDLHTNISISKFEVYELPDSLFDGSDSVHYIENGKVGIGTTSPSTALHVISKSSGDGITISTSQDISVAKLYNTNSESFPVGALSLQYGSTNAGLISGQSNRLNIRGGGSSGGSISFASHTTEMMRLTSTGLGIGTTSPQYILDAFGTDSSSAINTNVAFNISRVVKPDLTNTTATLATGTELPLANMYYSITYYNAIGETERGGFVSILPTSGNQRVQLNNLPISPDPSVIGRKIYRNKSTDGSSYGALIATIADNTTTSYLDSLPESDPVFSGHIFSRTIWALANTTTNFISVDNVRSMVVDPNLTVFGYNSGQSITRAASSTLIGSESGKNITYGSGNTLVGYRAGLAITTGPQNVLIGDNAGAQNLTTGGYNIALGPNTLKTNGDHNIAMGYYTGQALGSGNRNVLIGGYIAQGTSTNFSDSVIIGVNATNINGTNGQVNINNLIFGNKFTQQVGIGTTSPLQTLHVNGNIQQQGTTNSIYMIDGGEIRGTSNVTLRSLGTFIALQSSGSLFFQAADTERMRIDSTTGNVGIGTTSPTSPLHVAGNLFVDGSSLKVVNNSVTNYYEGDRMNSYGTYYDWKFAGNTKMRITSAGNVGIGTTSPTTALQVVGRTKTSELHASNGNAIYTNQGSVAIGTSQVDATAVLNIVSTTKGVLFPRMTSSQRTAISSPATGLIVYQTDATEGLYIYKSTGWTQII